MPREFLYATKEAVPGVFDDEAEAEDQFALRLDRSNAFSALDKPNITRVKDMSGSNRWISQVAETVDASGTLSTILYPTQASLLAVWACTIANDPPEPPFTITFDHMRMMEDSGNTKLLRRYVGCMATTFSLNASNTGDNVISRMQFGFYHMGESTITGTDRPTPALADYPDIKPYVFRDLKNRVIVGSSRTHFSEVNIQVNNNIHRFYDEDRYPSRLSWRGREVTASVKFRLESLTDRDAMIAASARTAEVKFQAGTTPNQYSLNFDMHDVVHTVGDDEDRPLDGGFYHVVQLESHIDLTDGTDLTVTAAGPV